MKPNMHLFCQFKVLRYLEILGWLETKKVRDLIVRSIQDNKKWHVADAGQI